MSTDGNKRIEALTRLCEIAWTNFDRRRSYEWKFSIAIWTAITAFIALTLKGEVDKPPESAFWLVAGFVMSLQIFFLHRVKLANSADQKAALSYEKELNKAIGEPSEWSTVEQAREKARKFWKGYWSFVVHIGISLVLTVAAGFVIYSNTNTAGGKIMSGSTSVFNIIMAMAAIGSAIIAYCIWRTTKKTMNYQALVDVRKDYSSPQIFYAVKTLRKFYETHGKETFVEKYEEVREQDEKRISALKEGERIESEQYTLHYQRRIVSHFYQHLAALCKHKIIPRDIVKAEWSEADLRIIPEILIPIENKLREVLHTPPLGPLDEDCNLLFLYKDSKSC